MTKNIWGEYFSEGLEYNASRRRKVIMAIDERCGFSLYFDDDIDGVQRHNFNEWCEENFSGEFCIWFDVFFMPT